MWDWAAIRSRWEPVYGWPERPAMVGISTDAVAARERYDFWRHIAYYHFDAAPRPAGAPFEARATGAVSTEAELFLYESDGVEGAHAAHQALDGGDYLGIGLVLAGERRSEEEGDCRVRTAAGLPFVFDPGRSARIGWTRHRGLHLNIRGARLIDAVGTEIPQASRLVDGLRRASMFPLLRDQLVTVARSLPALDADGRALALDIVCRVARHTLGQALQTAASDGGHDPSDLYVAALSVIERHLAHPNLGPEAIARALGCSRATLYRAFQEQGQGVADVIHDLRFRRARHKLETAAPGRGIAEIAIACGILDTVNFSRRFRDRFGMAPSEVRGASLASGLAP